MRTGPLAPQSRKRYIGALTNDLQQLDGVWHGYLIVELQPPPSLQYSSTSGRTRLIPLHQIPHATQAIPINSLTQLTEQYLHSGEGDDSAAAERAPNTAHHPIDVRAGKSPKIQ